MLANTSRSGCFVWHNRAFVWMTRSDWIELRPPLRWQDRRARDRHGVSLPPFRLPPRRDGIIVRGEVTGGNGLAVQVGMGFAAMVSAF